MARNPKLDALKYEVAEELGLINSGPEEYKQFLQDYKYEAANEVGVNLKKGYNGDLTTKEAGQIGGRIGGKIGGNMVKKMIEQYESQM